MRRITDGGGNHGSRARALSTVGAESTFVGAESRDSVGAATTCVVSTMTPADSSVTIALVTESRRSESTITTGVESPKEAASVTRLSGLANVDCDGPVFVAARAADAESSEDARSTDFVGGSSPRASQAPTPMLTNAPIPTYFQMFGPTVVFAGAVPHHLHAPWWSG